MQEPLYSSAKLIREMAGLIRPYRLKFFVATLLRLSADIAWLYPAYALSQVVTILSVPLTDTSFERLAWVIGIWIVASLVRYVNIDVAKYVGFTIAERVALNAQLKTLGHLMNVRMSWHERENTGNKMKRIQKGADGIGIIVRMWFINFIEIFVNFVGVSIVISQFDVAVSGIIIVFLVTQFAISFFLTRKTLQKINAANIAEEEVSGLQFETINNIRSVKVLGMQSALMDILTRRIQELFFRLRDRVFWYRIRQVSLSVWGQLFRLGSSIFIIVGVMRGHYEVGFLVLFYEYFNRIWSSVDELSNVAQEFGSARYSIARMNDIFTQPVSTEGTIDFPEDWSVIELTNVSFSYGTNAVLKDLTLTIRRGQKIGIIGLSGAGKTTLMRILLKERGGYKGTIAIDGIPLRNIRRDAYFRKVAPVLQDTEVFNFSLKENIIMANMAQQQNQELFDRSLSIAHVKDFLHKLPQGVDTLIGEKGIKLSGGERQRLGIARAVFKEPQLLFLDEATSHLDLESEEKIRDSLHQFFQSVTAIVIAHRLTTIREMDQIIVLENGRIIEKGSFEELQALKGRFYELWEKQKF